MHSRSISFWPFGTRGSGEGGSQASISGNRLDSDQPPGPESSPWPLPESSLEASSALDLAISAFEKSCIAAAQQETWLIPAWFISFFNAAHGYGLPWWAAIASVNLAARFLLLPFFIFQQKETARMASFNYDMIKVKHLQEAMTKAKTQEEQTHLHSAIKQEYSSVMAKYPNALVSFTSIPLVLVGNGLVFISIFQATSNLMNTKAPSLRDGGTLWFTDLTAPDPYFGLPIICSLVTLALVEYGISMSGDQTPAGMQPGQAKAFKLMMRVMCLLFIPMGFVWSSGSGVLIATNSAFAVVQGMALRSPSFRHRVGLPSLSEVAAMSKKVAEASQPKKMEDATALANSILEKVAKDDQGRPLLFEEDPLKRKWKGQEGPLPPPPALAFACYSGFRAYQSSQTYRSREETNSEHARSDREVVSDNRKLLRGADSSFQEINDNLKSITDSLNHPCPSTTAAVVPTLTVNPRLFHVLTTCQGFSNHWQARVHYYWYVKQRTICRAQGGCDMGGFTRILHSGQADDLMDEIPTVVVNPLPKSIMKDSSYIVLNRPYAFQEWVQTISIPEKYVIMAEADHLWMRPLPNLMNGEAPGAAHFTYIVPEKYSSIVKKFVGQGLSDDEWSSEVKKVPQIGNSPTMLSVKDLRALVGPWYNMTMRIFDDKEAHEAWNWVLEMYGYSLASYEVGQHKGMAIVDSFLAHPPFDKTELNYESKPFYLLHLTYPIRFNSTGGLTEDKNATVWLFDKRDYGSRAPPRNLAQPPGNVDCALCRLIITMLNEATDAIPCWDQYVETGKVTTC